LECNAFSVQNHEGNVLSLRFELALAAFLLLAAGCGGAPDPAAVSGSVSFQGQPVGDGAIRFVPRNGTPGGGIGAVIQNGRYQVPIEERLASGQYYVAITATRPTGKQVRRFDVKPGEPTTMPEVAQYIPAKFNDEYSLSVELPAGESQQDFSLQ
jgi:hypothetical protein